MPVERIQPPGMIPHPMYTPVVKHGNTVYLAGQTARSRGELVGPGDITAQAEQVFRNMQEALSAVNGTLNDLVNVTIYLTDPRFREPFNEVQRRYLKGPLPASTLLVVAGLALPELLVEVSGIAVVGG